MADWVIEGNCIRLADGRWILPTKTLVPENPNMEIELFFESRLWIAKRYGSFQDVCEWLEENEIAYDLGVLKANVADRWSESSFVFLFSDERAVVATALRWALPSAEKAQWHYSI